MENKKVALIFLYFIGAIQLVAGVYTQLVGLFHWDFMSLFPVVEMGTQQILYLNLLAGVPGDHASILWRRHWSMTAATAHLMCCRLARR